MDDKSMANQGATTASQAALDAQQEIAGKTHYAGGGALLDANAEVNPQASDPDAESDATNFSGDRDTDDPTEAENYTTTGDYPVDFTQLDDEGNLSMTKDVPDPE